MFDLIGKCKSVFVGMTVLALLTAVPVDCAIAAIIETQATQGEQNPANYRARLATLLAREEVRLALLKHGIDSTEVKLRVAALTDDEIILLSKTIENYPAGGQVVPDGGFVLVACLMILAVVLIFIGLIALGIWGGTKLYDKYNEQKETAPGPGGQDLVLQQSRVRQTE